MSLGHEPIIALRLLVGIAVMIWCADATCQNMSAPENSWTIGPNMKQPDAAAPANQSEASVQNGPELTSPAELGRPAPADSIRQPQPRESGDDDWLEEAELGLNQGSSASLDEHQPDRNLDEASSSRTHHRVPGTSLWIGPGLGWSVPFGDLWGSCVAVDSYGRCAVLNSVPSRDYFGSGLSFEFDAGFRLGRNYNLYGLWERTWYASRNNATISGSPQTSGESDFVAVGLRVSTDPEELGFLLDIAVGTRRMRARWADGTQLQLTEAPFETRIGIGADVRLDDHWSFTPLLALGVGSFGKVETVHADGTVESTMSPTDVSLTHGWLGLQLATHADLLGTQ